MAPTIHQRVHLWVWHWKEGPGWIRGSEIKTLRNAGARVIRVQLQDDGAVTREVVDHWKEQGFRVWGVCRPSGSPLKPADGSYWDPKEAAHWIHNEKKRLALQGLDLNGEADVRQADLNTGGQWSADFTAEYRYLMPTLSSHFDTYHGPAGSGINLGAYLNAGFRFSIQTYWGANGLYDDTIPNIVSWCKGASPSIRKAIIKPVIRVVPNQFGQLPNYGQIYDDCKTTGTKGLCFYYVDGTSYSMLTPLIQEAIQRGIAY